MTEGGVKRVRCETGHPQRSQASFGLHNKATLDKPLHLCFPGQWPCTGRENHLTHELPAVSCAQQAGLGGWQRFQAWHRGQFILHSVLA